MPSTTCDACGAADDDLVEVHRLYVTPESWDTEASVTRVDETESWCFPCRTHYPHETAHPATTSDQTVGDALD